MAEEEKQLVEQVSIPNFDWLFSSYELQLACAEPQPLPGGMLKLYKIEEITYEDESPRQEALENVLASLKITGINLVYLILGERDKVSFYFGVAADQLDPQQGINLDEIAKKILAPSLRGNFRGSKISEVKPEELNRIRAYIMDEHDKKHAPGLNFACVEGVPGVTKDKEKKDFQGVDRLVDIMLGDEFGLLVIAKPINNPAELDTLEKSLEEIYRLITLQAKQQLQTGKNESENTGESTTKGTQRSNAEGKQVSKNENTAYNASNSVAKGRNESDSDNYTPSGGGHGDSHSKGTSETGTQTKGRTDTYGITRGETVQVTRGVMEQVAKQTGNQVGTSSNLSFDIVRKGMQEWLKYFDEVIFPRLDCARGKGLFVSSTLLFAKEKPVLTKLSNVMKSIFSGEIGNRSPLHTIPLSEKENGARLKALKNFQQPLLQIRGSAGTLEECYAASAHSKCLHYTADGALTDFYAGNWMSSVELGMMAGIPQKEVVGLRLREEVEFGLNVVNHAEHESITLGNLVQGGIATEIPVSLDTDEFDRHMFIAGVTGSGKTTTCQSILCSAKRHFLVIEPAKTEYRILLTKPEFKDDLLIFTLGDDTVAPFRLNPLEFTKGESISSRVDMIMASITAAFDMEAAIPQLIESALYECYRKYGWNIKTNTNRLYPGDTAFSDGVYAFPSLGDVMDIMPAIIKKQGFDERLHDEYLGSIRARLQGLLEGAKGMMLNCKRSLNFENLLDHNVILELEEVRNGAEKSLIIGFVLANLLVAIKRKFKDGGNKKIDHITLVEEAHRLMSKFEPGDNPNKKHAVETFADMLAEIRKYGESMMIADQIPNKLTPDVLKNTNIKIVHRLFAQDDKDVIGSTMSLTEEQRDFLSNLEIGHAVVFSGSWPKAIHTAVKDVTDTSSKEIIPDETLRKNILKYYASQYQRGIFPGLEILKQNPSIETLEKYVKNIQNVDIKTFFAEDPSAVSPGISDEHRCILNAMLSECGKDVSVAALVALYLEQPEPESLERLREAVKHYIDYKLHGGAKPKDLRYIKTLSQLQP